MGQRSARLETLRARLRAGGLGALAVTAPSNVFYLSGFRGSNGALLIDGKRALLFSDFRYRLQAREQAPAFELIEVERHPLAALGVEAQRGGVDRLGYDQANLTCELRDQLAEGAERVELAQAGGLVEELRAVKSSEELGLIRAAAALADQALVHMVALLRPGVAEREIALEGEFYLRREGAEAAAFDIIVASGPRSALPHADATDRTLEKGDLVVIDIGARVRGYCSDMTRTFALGRASTQAQEVYRIVYRAQRAAAAQVRAGAVGGDLDAVARGIIEDAGYAGSFGHGLGHGVGIEVHEAPRLRRGEEGRLAAGCVITVEPGIYLEGIGGVRLEDLLAVRENGAEVLTGSTMPAALPVV